MKIVKRVLLGVLILFIILITGLSIYARNPYQPLSAMDNAINDLDTSSVTVTEKRDHISFQINDPIKQILFIPGGLVNPHSYDFLAYNLALNGYDVIVFKPLFDLAILSPNYAARFLSDTLDNVIMGHSLGGIVASMIAAKQDDISTVILMGSYPIKDIQDKKVLIITAEFDINMDQEAFDNSLLYVNDSAEVFDIDGGNHAQFGWYGPQKGDGDAQITTLIQQTTIIEKVVDFLT